MSTLGGSSPLPTARSVANHLVVYFRIPCGDPEMLSDAAPGDLRVSTALLGQGSSNVFREC
jgi:hypothetical protein